MENLKIKAFGSIVLLFIIIAGLLFISAGTTRYWQAWIFLAVYFSLSFAITVYLAKNDPKLLERRMHGGPGAEKTMIQKIIMLLASIGFIALLVVPALDHRFMWSQVPVWVVLAGNTLIVIGYYIIFRVFTVNTFTAATVEIHKDQVVISTGPYAWVRHPMYFGGLLYLLGMPLALGSFWGLVVFVPLIPILIWRLFDEDKLLAKDLPGYVEYQEKVKYRLVPFIW